MTTSDADSEVHAADNIPAHSAPGELSDVSGLASSASLLVGPPGSHPLPRAVQADSGGVPTSSFPISICRSGDTGVELGAEYYNNMEQGQARRENPLCPESQNSD